MAKKECCECVFFYEGCVCFHGEDEEFDKLHAGDEKCKIKDNLKTTEHK